MLIRIGVPSSFARFSAVASELGAGILVSANAFYKDGRFRVPDKRLFNGVSVALDSAGFVAMFRYWGYRWLLGDYVDFAGHMNPDWWAAPDYCCEPEISRDREEVLDRVRRTAFKLDWARQVAADRGVAAPMPVLQGWLAEDYLRCADLVPDMPELVGVGSMCRRSLGGNAGIIRIVNELDRYLPQRTKLHLFGIKGAAIGALTGHPRIFSVDSCAWDAAARREKDRHGHDSCTIKYREMHMRRWYTAQRDSLRLFANG